MAKASSKPKVVLAYSGGLDTSIIVRWLADRGFEVICFCANVGQEEKYTDLKEGGKFRRQKMYYP